MAHDGDDLPDDRIRRTFSPGFRLSALDGLVLIAGGVASLAVARIDTRLAAGIAFVVAHFFLFCNVLRMSRPLELTWAGLFAALSVAATRGAIGWSVVWSASVGLTAVLAVVELRRPSYHGVGWRRVNPGLRTWWAARQTAADRGKVRQTTAEA